MTSFRQSKYWTRPSDYQNKVQWNQYHPCNQEQSFVEIRKSRKGTRLNVPETFYTEQIEQPFIETIPILPAGGCCDMEYVMYRRQNALKRQIPTNRNTCCSDRIRYSPSVTINIGTPQTFNQTQYRGACRANISYSTISINPTVVSEEPFVKKEFIPLGLNCCGQSKCEHTQMREQNVFSLEPEPINKLVDEKGFVYVTKPPTISPLKECWKIFTCKKKLKKTDTYMPSVMTKAEPKECKVCPKDSTIQVRESELYRISRNQAYAIRSKLSTITESEVTVSEYSSEEFVSEADKDKKEKKKLQCPQKSYDGIGKVLQEASLHSAKYSSTIYQSPQYYQQPEGIHRWVCKPVEENKRLFSSIGNKKYICYKES